MIPRHARPEPVTRAEFDALQDKALTLNGKPARVTGRTLRFARVYQIDAPTVSAEFCWETVLGTADNGGAFHT